MEIKAFMRWSRRPSRALQERITGRFIAETITDPDTGEVVIEAEPYVYAEACSSCYGSTEQAGQ